MLSVQNPFEINAGTSHPILDSSSQRNSFLIGRFAAASGKEFVAVDKSHIAVTLSVGSRFAVEFCLTVVLASDKNET